MENLDLPNEDFAPHLLLHQIIPDFPFFDDVPRVSQF
jgi:hypothetical protein